MEKLHVSDIGVRFHNEQATSGTRTIMKNDTIKHLGIQFQEQENSSEKFELQFSSQENFRRNIKSVIFLQD